jgi:hypothetical protein
VKKKLHSFVLVTTVKGLVHTGLVAQVLDGSNPANARPLGQKPRAYKLGVKCNKAILQGVS